ncbi:hypothetical protein BGZ67_008893 [Mortierella alpina]|nr:hypothetical protein BGZ67_008893 [Mortierella alpina]
MTKYPKLSTAKTPHLGQRSPPNESISHRYQLDQQQRIKRASSKSSGTKKLTDSAHYRARNAFFMFRGFVSRLQCTLPCKSAQASDYLKLRQAHIERRIEFHAAGDDQTGPWADIPLEDTFKWTEFQQLYYESDLFKWHRDNYLGQDGVLDVEGLKRIWVENEQSYEKTFTQAARQRTALEISGNRRKIGQGVRRP